MHAFVAQNFRFEAPYLPRRQEAGGAIPAQEERGGRRKEEFWFPSRWEPESRGSASSETIVCAIAGMCTRNPVSLSPKIK